MQILLEAEGTTPGRRERLAGAYNKGYQAYALTYRVCTPSAQEASDALVICQRARGALIVGRKDRTKASEIAQLASVMATSHITLLGASLNEY